MVEATIGDTGSSVTFAASAEVASDTAETSVSGVVLDNTNVAVPDVTVSIDNTALPAQTTAEGRFFLQSTPAEMIHLVVDGRRSTARRLDLA